MRRNRSIRVFGTMLLLFVLATATYAFTAANTVPDTKAGVDGGTITGYTVSGITYDFAPTDGAQIAGVSFDLDAAAGSALVRFNETGTWVSCTEDTVTANNWDCAITANTVDIVNLEVAAAD